jgi:hypothetical protein
MYGGQADKWDWKNLGVLALLFVIVGHHKTYEIMQDTLGSILPGLDLVNEDKEPTLLGYVLHALLFVIVWELVRQNVLER